ncbi:T6SS phospholipase effector Tle1-like catalytic domain-containing protein [Cystobacter fuscus]
MASEQESKKLQSPSMLIQAASLSSAKVAPTNSVPLLIGSSNKVPSNAVRQGMKISFFFDGTGNNLDADYGTREHSNVARLFRAHQEDARSRVAIRYYIPGLGTRFKDINDPGGKTTGLAFGGMGEERLEWAMKKLESQLAQANGRSVHVALFGFSRGAALARAFARRLADRCTKASAGGWTFQHKNTRIPFQLYFMGLFDTVASVGAPMGTNNLQSLDLTAGMLDLEQAMKQRHLYGSTLDDIAFARGGAPGADPASGLANGHMAWADDLRIPDMVGDCLHMIAAHEIRNSFPVDSLLEGSGYPKNCRERVYPGAHSDVGGGYRKGEGARSPVPGSFLSLIPLRHMRDEAIQAGVPLYTDLPEVLKEDFAEDPASKAAFQVLCRRFDLYMKKVGRTAGPLGEVMLAHSQVFQQWRFFRAASDEKARGAYGPTRDRPLLNQFQPVWQKEEQALKKRMDALEKEYKQAQGKARMLLESRATLLESGRREYQTQTALAVQKQDQFLTQKSRYDTLPSSDISFSVNSKLYDRQLIADARELQALAKKKGRDRLRPHYFTLLYAYEAEFERKQGMRNEELIAFFDTYVHDSLAGFAKDATLPSDPRVIYTGGDDKLRYASNAPTRSAPQATALG